MLLVRCFVTRGKVIHTGVVSGRELTESAIVLQPHTYKAEKKTELIIYSVQWHSLLAGDPWQGFQQVIPKPRTGELSAKK